MSLDNLHWLGNKVYFYQAFYMFVIEYNDINFHYVWTGCGFEYRFKYSCMTTDFLSLLIKLGSWFDPNIYLKLG